MARMNRLVEVKGCCGPITTFVIEPFVPHDEEYYLCITSERLFYEISFCDAGGINIEENWDKLRTIRFDTLEKLDSGKVAPLISTVPQEIRLSLESFILDTFSVFLDLDATMLEMNPFTLLPSQDGGPMVAFPLDIRLELDDTARFRSAAKWASVEFPLPFGRTLAPAEAYVSSLDEGTGASLKFTVLNPKGRVWLMVAGGGASVIYTDTVGDLGYAGELGNYGEYSGAPNTQETYFYAKTVLGCVTADPDHRGRALLIGGGIANFTDVAGLHFLALHLLFCGQLISCTLSYLSSLHSNLYWNHQCSQRILRNSEGGQCADLCQKRWAKLQEGPGIDEEARAGAGHQDLRVWP